MCALCKTVVMNHCVHNKWNKSWCLSCYQPIDCVVYVQMDPSSGQTQLLHVSPQSLKGKAVLKARQRPEVA